jgi:hypothetical protein
MLQEITNRLIEERAEAIDKHIETFLRLQNFTFKNWNEHEIRKELDKKGYGLNVKHQELGEDGESFTFELYRVVATSEPIKFTPPVFFNPKVG